MKLKIILIILISLVMILNIFIPTVTLAVNMTNEISNRKNEDNKENNKTENTITDNTTENEETKNEIIDNNIKNEGTENEIIDNTIENSETSNETPNNENNNLDNSIVNENVEKNEQNNGTINENTEILENENQEEQLQVLNTENTNTDLSVSYRTHVQYIGWQDYVQNGEMAGTQDQSLRLEAINIKLLNNTDENIGIKYQVHAQNYGWMDWKQDGEMAGTQDEGLRLEAIKIDLENSEKYSIMYRVHIQNIGWQEWKTDGEIAGTEGQSLRLEAIEIKIVEKQKKGKLCVDTPSNGTIYYNKETSNISVVGWKMANVSNSYIKAYLDGKEIDTKTISYYERPDVIQAITDYGTEKQNPTPGFRFDINTTNFENRNYVIKIELYSENTLLETISKTVSIDGEMHVQYRTHVQYVGWQNYVQDGEMAGTQDQSLRLEAINLKLVNCPEENMGIKYQVHAQNYGWMDWKQNGEMAGTQDEGLRLEAIKIDLENSENYSVMYRVHIQNIGWQDWKTDGEMAGTEGQALRLEAIEIKIVKKQIKSKLCIDSPSNGTTYYTLETSKINIAGWKMANVPNTYIKAYFDGKEIENNKISYKERPDVIQAITDYGTAEQNPMPGFSFDIDISSYTTGSHALRIEMWYQNEMLEATDKTIYLDSDIHIKYSAHVQYVGWQDYVVDGAISGTVEQALRLEALKIELINTPNTAHIEYRVYIQGTGWTEYVKDGEQAGTTGQDKKIQAIQIKVEGLDGYVVEYQAHMQEKGWQSWAANNMEAGLTSQSLRMEALKIRLVKEENSIVPQVRYSAHNETNGWLNYEKNGITLGNTNNSLKLDAIKVILENAGTANIKYRVHAQEVGWLDTVQNDAQAGTGSSVNGIEAIEMEIEGLSNYSIEYRVYIIGEGWQDWRHDGQQAGTTGEDLQISAIQIRMAIKIDTNNTSNFANLDESKYPGYKTALQQLQSQYPNWNIQIYYTGLDWNDVINGEDEVVNGSPKSLIHEYYGNQSSEWINGTEKYDVSKEYYRASRKAIEYMMDPRNSLEAAWIFQFQDLASASGTREEIARMVSGTFLNTDSIIDTIISTAQEQNISPFHIVSRILQEQDYDGSGIMNGYEYLGKKVYNLFNINVSGDVSTGILAGARYAYDRGWFTPEASIQGGASFLKTYYISVGQSTLYFQKYNVVSSPYYNNQYMQNIRGANDEGNIMYNSYNKSGILNSSFTFLIPVYENMPTIACPRPGN